MHPEENASNVLSIPRPPLRLIVDNTDPHRAVDQAGPEDEATHPQAPSPARQSLFQAILADLGMTAGVLHASEHMFVPPDAPVLFPQKIPPADPARRRRSLRGLAEKLLAPLRRRLKGRRLRRKTMASHSRR